MNDPDLRALRREAARRHHPDVGGDAATFVAVMRSLDALEAARAAGSTGSTAGRTAEGTPTAGVGPWGDGPAAGPASAPTITVTSTAASRARRAVRTTSRRLVGDVRRRIPRSLPGSRRYGQL